MFMKKLLTLLACLSVASASAIGSQAVNEYKSTLSVHKIESSAPRSIISKYLIVYPGLKIYNPKTTPKEFNGVISTISTKPRNCKYGSFEYNLYINKTLWELPSIQRALKISMKASGYRAIKSNEFGVVMWETVRKDYAVTFVTKITPFTYVTSVCKV